EASWKSVFIDYHPPTDDNGETLGPARADGVQTTSTPESGAVCGDLRLLPRALSMKSRRPLDWGPRLSSSRDLASHGKSRRVTAGNGRPPGNPQRRGTSRSGSMT